MITLRCWLVIPAPISRSRSSALARSISPDTATTTHPPWLPEVTTAAGMLIVQPSAHHDLGVVRPTGDVERVAGLLHDHRAPAAMIAARWSPLAVVANAD